MENHINVERRVVSLEQKVDEQNNEIVYLRKTLEHVLHRLTAVENAKDAQEHQLLGSKPAIENGVLRANNTTGTPDSFRISFPLSRTNVRPSRRSILHHSTNSLLSEDPSSKSTSPVPSPTPITQNLQRFQQQNVNDKSPAVRWRDPGLKKIQSQCAKMSSITSLENAKRWSSTSDFNPVSASNTKKPGYTSLLNLSSRSNVGNFAKTGDSDAVHNVEEGFIKYYILGRPVIIYIPTSHLHLFDFFKVLPAPQTQKLKMEWIYGYRGKDCRSNVTLIPTGEIVYFTASVIVLFNAEEKHQRHYLGHNNDVKCLTLHPNKIYIASGQTAGRMNSGRDGQKASAQVRVWNSVNLQTLHTMENFEKFISCLAFSKMDGGNLLVVLDDSTFVSVWKWSPGKKIAETKCSSDVVLGVDFHPMERDCFVTCGKGHLNFWFIENGNIIKKSGVFESRDKPKYVTCLAFADNGDLLTGDSNGSIFIWPRGSNMVCKAIRNCHKGPVFSLLALSRQIQLSSDSEEESLRGGFVSGGGKDGQLILWDNSYRRTGYVIEIAERFGNVRTLSQGKGNQILVGTTRNCILGGNFAVPFTPLVLGHTDELCFCVHPSQNKIISGGYDKRVYYWDVINHTLIWSKDITDSVNAVCFTTNGDCVLLGTTCGKWIVMDCDTREIYGTYQEGGEPIQVLKFSKNGKLLSIGSENNIYVYEVTYNQRTYSRLGRCVGHENPIKAIDWAEDDVHFQSNAGVNELIYWNALNCRQVTQTSQLRDLEWTSVTCPLSFLAIGTLAEENVGSCCASSNSRHLIASGDLTGKLKLFSYPASQPNSNHTSFYGHTSQITNISFLPDDKRLISSGGRDSSFICWKIIQ